MMLRKYVHTYVCVLSIITYIHDYSTESQICFTFITKIILCRNSDHNYDSVTLFFALYYTLVMHIMLLLCINVCNTCYTSK